MPNPSPSPLDPMGEPAGGVTPDPGLIGRLRGRIVLNVAGLVLPLGVALLALPVLLRGLGPERFAILALAWPLIASLGLLDLGLGRALTQVVARGLARGDGEGLDREIQAVLLLQLGLGIAAALALWLAAPWVVDRLFQAPSALVDEAGRGLRLLALGLPAVTLGTGLRGFLEAAQRFGRVNAVRAPMMVGLALGPLLALPFGGSLVVVLGVLAAVRWLAAVGYAAACRGLRPGMWRPRPIRLREAGGALRLGGWMSVSHVIAPLLLYVDRFVLASLASLGAVALYAPPHEAVTRLSVIPAAVLGVAFPAFAAALVRDRGAAVALYGKVLRGLGLGLAPLWLGLGLLAEPLLTLWLGAEVATQSRRILVLLAAGMFFHTLAQPSFSLLQAAGRPDVTAKVHLLELPLYLSYLLPLVAAGGAEGAALAWALRVALSSLVLGFLARRLVVAPQVAAGEAA